MRLILALGFLFACFQIDLSPVSAQTFGMGITINQSALDYGFGLQVTSPQLAGSFQIRLSGNIQGVIGTNRADAQNSLYGYGMLRLGVVGKPSLVIDDIRIYAEGGPLMLINNSQVTSKKIGIGGYGMFGMEYQMSAPFWVFLEGGGIGTGAKGEKLIGSPSYETGLFFGMGLRFYLS